MNVALEIRAEAARQQITLKEVAHRMNTYPERLSRAFNGERKLKYSEVIQAANALGVPASELMRRAEKAEKQAESENPSC